MTTPKVPENHRLVMIESPVRNYLAVFADKYWEYPSGVKTACIGRLTENGAWSHGMLKPDEKIIEL